MRLVVEYLGHIRNMIGLKRQEKIEMRKDSSVRDLLQLLLQKHGKPFEKAVYEQGGTDIKPNFMATVNGCLLNQLRGLETVLKDGDRVVLMPVVSGG